MPNKFEITVMFDSTIPVDERTVEQLMLKAMATKEFMLPGQCQVYARSLDDVPRGNIANAQPLPPHIDTKVAREYEREKQETGAHLLEQKQRVDVSPLPPPISGK